MTSYQIEFIRKAIAGCEAGSLARENQEARKAFDAMLKDYIDLENYYNENESKS